jgi:hypothetical protein
MEASGAGQAQDSTATDQAQAASDAQPTGTGVVVICGQYEPGSIVTLHKVAGEGVLRAEGSPVVGQRVVDDAEEVGFDSLEVGGRYIAAGYTRGRYEEVSVTAHDIDANVELMQPPERPIPATLGTQGTSVVSSPAAPSEGAADLGTGLPEGVTSPMLDDREQADSANVRDDAGVSPGDVDGVMAPGATESAPSAADERLAAEAAAAAPDTAAEAQAASSIPEAGPAQATADSATTAPAGQAAGTDVPAQAADAAPVGDANPAAPGAGTPDASDSSGTGQANGGAVEEPAGDQGASDSPDQTAAGEAAADPAQAAQGGPDDAATPSGTDAAPQTDAWAVLADAPAAPADAQPAGEAPAVADPAPEGETDEQKLVAQAQGLGIPTDGLSVDALRAAITEKQVTPVV